MLFGNLGSSLVALTGGSSSRQVETTSGASTKNLVERILEMLACVCARPPSAWSGGILFIFLPYLQVATSQRLDFPMTSSAHFRLALRAAARN